MIWLKRLRWVCWRALHQKAWKQYKDSSILPDVRLLHQILERLDSDTFIYLVSKINKQTTFKSCHWNLASLIEDIERRNREIELKRAFGPEKHSLAEPTVREFFIGENRSYIQYGPGYTRLRSASLELLQNVQRAMDETKETLSENYISRRSVKMLLTVERLLMTVCR